MPLTCSQEEIDAYKASVAAAEPAAAAAAGEEAPAAAAEEAPAGQSGIGARQR